MKGTLLNIKGEIFMSVKIQELSDVLTAKDIAEFLGISYNSTLKLIKYNMVYLKLGSTYRVTKENFLKFLQTNVSTQATIN